MNKEDNPGTNKEKQGKKKSAGIAPFVVGIGASAGGLQALDAMFQNVPRDSVSYVIVQHLAPEQRNMLAELLSRNSVLRFREAEQDQALETNTVYIIPTGKYLTLKQGRLQLSDRSPDNVGTRTIDTFFKSLAKEMGAKAIGIILSGTGTDGTDGIISIKKHGGLVLVQDPDTAKFDGMPRNAISTGLADQVLPPEMMPDEIFNYVKVIPLTNEVNELLAQNEPSFNNILHIVRERTGIDFTYYKRPTLIRRISRRMAICNVYSLVNYLDYLQLHPTEIEILSKEFLISVTKFFRDPEAFEVLKTDVVPALVGEKSLHDQLRIWVTACATGEEAYSLAILVREYLDEIKKEIEVKIFASDIDRDALDFGGTGLYPEAALAEIPETYREKYFTPEEDKFRVTARIRRMVIFAQHNVINDPPFSKMDLITCRNMLIYLSPMLQKKVITKFHYSLQVGGYLFLGPSENLHDNAAFTEVNKKWKIFRSHTQARALGIENFVSSGAGYKKPEIEVPSRTREFNPRHKMHHRLAEILNDAVLEEFAYAAVYIDENYELLHGFGNYTQYLTLPDRQFTFNILKLVPHDLAMNLGSMLRKAVRDKEKLIAQGIQVRDGETVRHINVVIKPYLSDKKLHDRFILVLFSEDAEKAISVNEPQIFRSEIHYETRVNELEIELQHTKEDLQSVVEELETANEELQSTNEELLSSNEELQSANEELQSLNEELNTINAEHQYKIKMLIELDDDLNNFFRSTDIGQIYVDRHLIIRKFTPATTGQINLINGDIGRSILQITHNIEHPGFIDDIRQCINQTVTIEREVQDINGTWYLMRILPYVTQERIIEGAIILFVNIHELKNMHLIQASILNSSPNAILALKAIRNSLQIIVDFECILLNNQAEALLGVAETDILNKPLSRAYPHLLHHELMQQYIKVVTLGTVLNMEENQQVAEDQNRWIHLIGVKLNDGLVLTLQEITERKNYEQQLLQQQTEIKASAERFQTLLEAVPHITWTNKPTGENESFNQIWKDITGLTTEESVGWGWTNAIHPDDRDRLIAHYQECLATGKVYLIEARLYRKADNTFRWHIIKAVPIRDENQNIYLWIGTAIDVQDQKDAQDAYMNLRLAQQKELLTTVLKTQEAERKRISEALHNGLGQILYAAKLNIDDLKPRTDNNKLVKERVDNLLKEAIATTRQISFELTPSVLRDFGLKAAIEELTRRFSQSLVVTCDLEGLDERFSDLIEISLYRVIQELMNNIIKHAQATQAHIELINDKEFINLRVQDNGTGFKEGEATRKNGIGLSSIRNRVKLLDGVLKIDSRPGKGTSVEIKVATQATQTPSSAII